MGKESKNYRTLDMYLRLCEGKVLNKKEEASRFEVDERSIQRDIDDIRGFIDEKCLGCGDTREVIYDRSKKGFVMIGAEQYEHECVLEAEVYGKGCLMWLLSQGDRLEILRPESLREDMKEMLLKMLDRYQ